MTEKLTNLGDYVEKAYLTYSMKVVTDRSLPFVQDGLKPVHRRIIYVMYKLGLHNSIKHMKSARIVGEVLGKFHPHGDSSVYESMVNMTDKQTNLRYPIIDGQGNWGSRDGDAWAAMRYTEAKLHKIARCFIDEINLETVDFKPNFDGSEIEPALLPTRLPFLILNGSYGIAVALATNFPSHNIKETIEAAKLLLKKPKATFEDVMEIINGPDYITGCKIITPKSEIVKVYKEGRGNIRLRSLWRVDKDKNGKDWTLVFYEIPQGTCVEQIMEKIGDILNPNLEAPNLKAKQKEEKIRLKKVFSDLIDSFTDLSTKKDGLAIAIKPKNKKQDPEQLALALCAHTDLEMSMSTNFNAIDENKSPRNKNIREWLREWCDFRVETVRRRITEQLRKVNARLHIIDGKLLVIDKIDAVIKLLKVSDSPKEDLMKKFKLDEIQAESILEMTLRSIAKMGKLSLEEDKARLLIDKGIYEEQLSDEKNIKKVILKELDEDLKEFGDDRKTILDEQPHATLNITADMVQDKASNEMIAVSISERGWIGWKVAKKITEIKPDDFKFKTGDAFKRIFIASRADTLAIIDNNGKGYSLPLIELAGRNGADPFTKRFNGAKIVEGVIISNPETQKYIIAGEKGYGFVVKGSDWITKQKAGKQLITLVKGENPLPPVSLPENCDGKTNVVFFNNENKFVSFPLEDLKEMPKGKGVALMHVDDNQKIVDIDIAKTDGTVTLFTENNNYITLTEKDIKKVLGTRKSSSKGKVLMKNDKALSFHRPLNLNNDTESDDTDESEES